MKKIFNYISKHPNTIFLYSIFILAFLGIACAMIGHYGRYGFDWKWFVFFEGPLYTFCGWAIFKAMKTALMIMDTEDKSVRKSESETTTTLQDTEQKHVQD